MKAAKAMKAVGVKKESKVEIEEVPKASIMKAMPKDVKEGNPAPVHYGGGVVYTDQKGEKFRALRVRGDRYTECAKSWKSGKIKAWKACIQAIDDHHKPIVKDEKKKKNNKGN